MNNIINYIIKFLLPCNETLASAVGYTNVKEEFKNFSVIISPSGFFDENIYGKISSLPKLPLNKIDDAEILFGTPEVEVINGKVLVKADIIAGSFFLLSRYQEWICGDVFDNHSRFEGKKSLQYRADFLHRPIIEQYSALLRKWLKIAGLEVKEPPKQIEKIYLTHDIDRLALYQNFREITGAIIRKKVPFNLIINSILDIKNAPAYTFNWLNEQDLKVDAEKIYFVKAANRAKSFDYPKYNLKGKNFQNLLKFLRQNNSVIGLHSSYHSFSNPQNIEKEQSSLTEAVGEKINFHRTHYLRILPPHKPDFYLQANITDDFSLGFADIAGFRLGTCRPVKWINPQNLQIENITLHPLLIMESTLSDAGYMNLNFEDALSKSKNLIAQVKEHNGEIVLLWHNTSVIENQNNYQRNLYGKIIEYLANTNPSGN
jgi:hypothetical protein